MIALVTGVLWLNGSYRIALLLIMGMRWLDWLLLLLLHIRRLRVLLSRGRTVGRGRSWNDATLRRVRCSGAVRLLLVVCLGQILLRLTTRNGRSKGLMASIAGRSWPTDGFNGRRCTKGC